MKTKLGLTVGVIMMTLILSIVGVCKEMASLVYICYILLLIELSYFGIVIDNKSKHKNGKSV